MSESLMSQMEAIVNQKSIPERHSFYQLQCFVIGKEPTNQARLRQCILELKARKNSLEALELELEDQADNLALTNYEIEQLTLQDFKFENDIQSRKLKRKKLSTEKQIKELEQKRLHIAEEALFLVETYNRLVKIEPLKNWDDIEVQKQYWNEKLKYELNLRFLLKQNMDLELLKTILALDNESPVKKEVLLAFQQKPAELPR